MAPLTTDAANLAGTLLCIVGMVGAWMVMGLIVKNDKPENYYFMAYVVHGAFAIFLLPWGMWVLLQENPRTVFSAYNWRRNLQISGILGCMVVAVSYLWYHSLPLTTLAANTAIYNSSSAFVLLLSTPLLGRPLKLSHCLCVVVSCVGILLTSMFSPTEETTGHGTAFGYGLVLASTFTYALFEVLYKRWDIWEEQMKPCVWLKPGPAHQDSDVENGSDSSDDTEDDGQHLRPDLSMGITVGPSDVGSLIGQGGNVAHPMAVLKGTPQGKVSTSCYFTGLVGLSIIVLTWPGLPLMKVTGWEPIGPPSTQSWLRLAGLSFFTAIYDGLLLASISLSSPLLVSLGTILTVPASVALDWAIRGIVPSPPALLGTALIVASFVGVALLPGAH